MNQQYFVVEFAHSVHGRVKQIRISYRSVGYLFCAVVAVALVAVGLFSSYLRMTWKASHYEQLRADFEQLRGRYNSLQRVSRQHNQELASLETLAGEVSAAYGISGRSGAGFTADEADNSPGSKVSESIEQYNFLKAASFGSIYHRYAFQWQSHTQPTLWPINGVLRSSFGGRSDPFSGEGTFHTGIDLGASIGTPVHAAADGVVSSAGWAGHYGKLVVIDHGNGLQTYYAHLSQFLVVPGQEVRRGEVIALSGCSGRATGPHMHYEVRLCGTPVNPYKYLARSPAVQTGRTATHSNDLGL
jgi:murein DD-endopeptidase MepM/ murein hydrolase activator NlpD